MSPGRQDAARESLRVLIVGGDRSLEEEFRSALAGIPDRQGVLYFAETYHEAIETARRRQPNVVLIEIDRDVGEIAGLTRDLLDLVPGCAVAGAFRPDRLEQGRSEATTLIELFRAHVRDFIRRPLSTTELRAVLDRLFLRLPGTSSLAQGLVAAFLSNKGGVGKSVLAVNVACGLALRHPDDVLLIDTSLQLGTCAFMLDLKPTTSIVDAIRERDRLDKTLLRHLSLRHPSGLRVLAAPADALEGTEVDDEAIARVVNLGRRTFKYVIVDTFPALDSVLMMVLDLADVAFVVVQGTAPAVAGVARLLPVLEGLGIPASRQRLVLNYNYKPFLGDLRPVDIGLRLQRTLDYVVPYDQRVLVSMNTGSPHILHAKRWQRFGRTINRLIEDLDGFAAGRSREPGPPQESVNPRVKNAAMGTPQDRRSKFD